jgi:hypothetical protein
MKSFCSIANEEASKPYCKIFSDITQNRKKTKSLDSTLSRGDVRAKWRTRGFARHPMVLSKITFNIYHITYNRS